VSRRVREDGAIGTLVETTGEPRGAVLVLGGSTRGMDETVATALAEAGFVSLALAYFGVPGLPDQLAKVPVETVERGVMWLGDHPSVGGLRVGLVGSSKAGELALPAATLFSEHLSAVVGFSASLDPPICASRGDCKPSVYRRFSGRLSARDRRTHAPTQPWRGSDGRTRPLTPRRTAPPAVPAQADRAARYLAHVTTANTFAGCVSRSTVPTAQVLV
jgi:hypothetical protein